ncbi:hypothetical protein HJC23_013330 [Cyclotella cryptica]|uniref:Uncharacterized protein n=1 Tax=Cyclotella cryptica TaxID=29204 RepID=A0ABD3Q0B9_9STRA|eukprot:CCRYP_009745-RA/>CCRYP_009745-RA protein AED:0.27 eAED:0.27 QI:0/-1/0/1/-1/1/1/0/546
MSLSSEDSPLLGLQITASRSKVAKNSRNNKSEQRKNMIWVGVMSTACILSLLVLHRYRKSGFNNPTPQRTLNDSAFDKIASPLSEELLAKLNASAKRHSHQVPLYAKVQTLSYQIYTGGAPAYILDDNDNIIKRNEECINLNSYGLPEGTSDLDLQCYLGLDDTAEDVSRRLSIMSDAVNRAYDIADPDETTLKIFLAPEFFFRGKNGAFEFVNEEYEESIGECSDICHILKGLENIVADERFEHWLFLFGTVIGSEKLPKKDNYDYQFYNFAPLYKGFNPATSKRIGKNFIVPKRYVSNIDFLTPLRHLTNRSIAMELLDETDPSVSATLMNPHLVGHKRYDNEMWAKYKDELSSLGYNMIEYGWFYMDGIAFSVEICLDHLVHRALMTYMADVVTGSKTRVPSSANDSVEWVGIPRHQAQISLVSSAGMDIIVASLALANGGHIYLQDGMDGNTPVQTTYGTDECQPNEYEFFGGSQCVKRTAVVSATDVTFEYEHNLNFTDYAVYADKNWKDVVDSIFSKELYEPRLTVYDPVNIVLIDHGDV